MLSMAIIEFLNCFLMFIARWIKFHNESLKSTKINTKKSDMIFHRIRRHRQA